MKLILKSLDSFNQTEYQALFIIAEKENLLGLLPSGLESNLDKLSTVIKNQTNKVLTDTFEIINDHDHAIIIGQVSQKKGLDRNDRLRMTAARILDMQKSRSLSRISISLDNISLCEFKSICEGLLISNYSFDKYKSEKKNKNDNEITLLVSNSSIKLMAAALAEVKIICNQIELCRNLVNEPGSSLDPQSFAKHAQKAAKEFGLAIKVRDEKNLVRDGYMGLWTVGKGSDHMPRMVTLEYSGGKGLKNKTHLCFVGKGVTFDTGGISIKPGSGMWEMKCDMAGAATALSAICAIAALKLPIKVTTVLCLAENRPGNASVLPGDIFTAKNGKTIMVDNTDAEGRLVLTDGLAEAGAKGATHIIDLATLTGAIVKALGSSIAGLFSNDSVLTQNIIAAGKNVGEKFCEIPIEEEYREYLNDPVADIKNMGTSNGGAITAALFLQEFVPAKTAWSHLDIAGTAFTTSKWKYYCPGGTGWGVKTLIEVARIMTSYS